MQKVLPYRSVLQDTTYVFSSEFQHFRFQIEIFGLFTVKFCAGGIERGLISFFCTWTFVGILFLLQLVFLDDCKVPEGDS
jgi:hypothetical protein